MIRPHSVSVHTSRITGDVALSRALSTHLCLVLVQAILNSTSRVTKWGTGKESTHAEMFQNYIVSVCPKIRSHTHVKDMTKYTRHVMYSLLKYWSPSFPTPRKNLTNSKSTNHPTGSLDHVPNVKPRRCKAEEKWYIVWHAEKYYSSNIYDYTTSTKNIAWMIYFQLDEHFHEQKYCCKT